MIQLLVQLVAHPCAHAVARQQGGRAFNHVAIIDDALTLLLGGIALRHLPARAKRHPKPFGQICASAKIEYGRAAVVQPLAQRSIVRFGPRLPLLNSPQLPVLRRSEEHPSELQSLMRTTYAVFYWKTNT